LVWVVWVGQGKKKTKKREKRGFQLSSRRQNRMKRIRRRAGEEGVRTGPRGGAEGKTGHGQKEGCFEGRRAPLMVEEILMGVGTVSKKVTAEDNLEMSCFVDHLKRKDERHKP